MVKSADPSVAQSVALPKTTMQRFLDAVERAGNMVPHPVVIFLILIATVLVLSGVFSLLGAGATIERINPATNTIEYSRTDVRSLLTAEGLRFIYVSLIPNFMGFMAVGLLIGSMIGAGVMEESGLVKTLIRKLVLISPAGALSYILAFVGIFSSIAADAGYLVLLPLAGIAFISAGRHPLAGLALAYAAVAGAFAVNMVIKPLDAILVAFTNDAIHLIDPARSIGLASNLLFSIASVIFLTIVIGLLNDRVVAPRLGAYTGTPGDGSQDNTSTPGQTEENTQARDLTPAESRGLRFAGLGVLAVLAVFLVLTVPSWAPLRNPETGALIGDSPFMNGLIGLIILLFLVSGWCYGIGAGTLRTLAQVIAAMEKAVSSLGGTIFLFFIISQFTSYFTYTNLGTVAALNLGSVLSHANLGPVPLLIAFMVVVAIIDIVIVGVVPKWAMFAPVFVPLLMKLGADPEAVLAAYRVGDSPMNALTPVNAYFGLVVGFARNYVKDAGVGTVVSLMLPYFVWMQLSWIGLFVVWQMLGLPWGI